MSEASDRRPNVRAAAARDRCRFCVAFSHLNREESNSIILAYDDSKEVRWHHFGVVGEINAATPLPDDYIFNGTNFALSSMEGDVFFIGDGKILHEKIPGTGLYAADATGAGQMFGIDYANGRLLATGDGNQIFERMDRDSWRPVFPTARPAGLFQLPVYSRITETKADGTYVVGFARPDDSSLDALAPSTSNWDEYMRFDATRPALREKLGIPKKKTDFSLYSDGGEWQPLHLLTEEIVYDIYVESPSRVWMVGTTGIILVGNARDGFKDVSFHGDRRRSFTLLSVTGYRGQIIVASDYGLHIFDGHMLSPLKPVVNPDINKGTPTPFRLQTVDDIMFYFDYSQGVRRWDGESWEEIVIPPELFVRQPSEQ